MLAMLARTQYRVSCIAKLSRHYLSTFSQSHPNQLSESYATENDNSSSSSDVEKTRDSYRKHRTTLKEKFPEGWNPPRKISREAMDGLRALHGHDPHTFSTPVLAEKFKISPEAVRRILKSKWSPSREKLGELLERDRRRKQSYIAARKEKEKQEQKESVDNILAGRKALEGKDKDELTLR